MIPKKIHYCWFGRNPLPPLAKRCINSWKKYLPDYEIIEWNEDNFDINICDYVREAYEAKKYAFVSDYARFWILYHYGGIYFDTDVEVIKPLNDIINKGAFMGCEEPELQQYLPSHPKVNAGLGLGTLPKDPIYKEILDNYKLSHFIQTNGQFNYQTVVKRVTDILISHGLKKTSEIQTICNITIYPPEYFCPKSYISRELHITPKTVSIHHYDASWMTGGWLFNCMMRIFGTEITFKLKHKIQKIKELCKK